MRDLTNTTTQNWMPHKKGKKMVNWERGERKNDTSNSSRVEIRGRRRLSYSTHYKDFCFEPTALLNLEGLATVFTLFPSYFNATSCQDRYFFIFFFWEGCQERYFFIIDKMKCPTILSWPIPRKVNLVWVIGVGVRYSKSRGGREILYLSSKCLIRN